MKRMSALSIRQPHAERILSGIKPIEYRSRPTSKRERIYIYASNTPAAPKFWRQVGLKPGDLPTGLLVGTVEIIDCRYRNGEYEWHLAKPKRLKRSIKPKKHPQPSWFFPF